MLHPFIYNIGLAAVRHGALQAKLLPDKIRNRYPLQHLAPTTLIKPTEDIMATKTNSDTAILEKHQEAVKPAKPPKFNVVLLNDDFTPFEFVIELLMDVFAKTTDQAVGLAHLIHLDGKGICGTYIKDIAELKQGKVMGLARQEGHPLQCVLEPESPAPGRSPKM